MSRSNDHSLHRHVIAARQALFQNKLSDDSCIAKYFTSDDHLEENSALQRSQNLNVEFRVCESGSSRSNAEEDLGNEITSNATFRIECQQLSASTMVTSIATNSNNEILEQGGRRKEQETDPGDTEDTIKDTGTKNNLFDDSCIAKYFTSDDHLEENSALQRSQNLNVEFRVCGSGSSRSNAGEDLGNEITSIATSSNNEILEEGGRRKEQETDPGDTEDTIKDTGTTDEGWNRQSAEVDPGDTEDRSKLIYELPTITMAGVNELILERYLSDGQGLNTLRQLYNKNVSQEAIACFSKCAMSYESLNHFKDRMRQLLSLELFEQVKDELKSYLKPYILSDFDFILSWSGSNKKTNSVAASFQDFRAKLISCGVEDEFFETVDKNETTIIDHYKALPDLERRIYKLKQHLLEWCNGQPFNPCQFIYCLLRKDAEDSLFDEVKRQRGLSFTRLYRQHIANKLRKTLLSLQKAIYQKEEPENESSDEIGEDDNYAQERKNDYKEQERDNHNEDVHVNPNVNQLVELPSQAEQDQDISVQRRNERSITDWEDESSIRDDQLDSNELDDKKVPKCNVQDIMKESTEFSLKEDVSILRYDDPCQHLVLVKCCHPIRLAFDNSVAYLKRNNLLPVHITCIVGFMNLYAELALLVQFSGFSHVRTMTFLQAPRYSERGFQAEMQKLLGYNWTHRRTIDITYGGLQSDKRKIVTFSRGIHNELSSLEDKQRKLDAWFDKEIGKAKERYAQFGIPAEAAHSLPKQYRKDLLLNSLQLEEGETCMEVGCGIPKLSLDMAYLSQGSVLMLDIPNIFNQLKDLFQTIKAARSPSKLGDLSCCKKRRRTVIYDSDETNDDFNKRRKLVIINDDDDDDDKNGDITIYLNLPLCKRKCLQLNWNDTLEKVYRVLNPRILTDATRRLIYHNIAGKKFFLPHDESILVKDTDLENDCTIQLEISGRGGMKTSSLNLSDTEVDVSPQRSEMCNGNKDEDETDMIHLWLTFVGMNKAIEYYTSKPISMRQLRANVNKQYRKALVYGNIGNVENTQIRINNCLQHLNNQGITTGLRVVFYAYINVNVTYDSSFGITDDISKVCIPKHMTTVFLYDVVRRQLEMAEEVNTITSFFYIVNNDLITTTNHAIPSNTIPPNASVKKLIGTLLSEGCNLKVIPCVGNQSNQQTISVVGIDFNNCDRFSKKVAIEQNMNIATLHFKIESSMNEYLIKLRLDENNWTKSVRIMYSNRYLHNEMKISNIPELNCGMQTVMVFIFVSINVSYDDIWPSNIDRPTTIEIRLDLSTDEIYDSVHDIMDRFHQDIEYLVEVQGEELKGGTSMLQFLRKYEASISILAIHKITLEWKHKGIKTMVRFDKRKPLKQIIPYIQLVANNYEQYGKYFVESTEEDDYFRSFCAPSDVINVESDTTLVIGLCNEEDETPLFCIVEHSLSTRKKRTINHIYKDDTELQNVGRFRYDNNVSDSTSSYPIKLSTAVYAKRNQSSTHIIAEESTNDCNVDNDSNLESNIMSQTINNRPCASGSPLFDSYNELDTDTYDNGNIAGQDLSTSHNGNLTSTSNTLAFSLSPLNHQVQRKDSIKKSFLKVVGTEQTVWLPLFLPYKQTSWINECTFRLSYNDESSSIFCVLDLTQLQTSENVQDLGKGFMIIGSMKPLDKSRKRRFIVGTPSHGCINIIKLSLSSRGATATLYDTVSKRLSRGKQWLTNVQVDNCILTIPWNRTLPLSNIDDISWNTAMNHISEINSNRQLFIKQKSCDRRRRHLLVSLPSSLVPVSAFSSNDKIPRTKIGAIGQGVARRGEYEKLLGRINQFHLSKEKDVFTEKLTLESICETFAEIQRSLGSQGYKTDVIDAAIGALSTFLFQDIQWRMDRFTPLESGQFGINDLSYDIDSMVLDIRHLQMIDIITEWSDDKEYLRSVQNDIQEFKLDIRSCGSSLDLGVNSTGKAGHTYMTAAKRNQYYLLPQDRDFILRCSVRFCSAVEAEDVIRSAVIDVAKYLNYRLEDCDPRMEQYQQTGGHAGGNMRLKGGAEHTLLTIALLLKRISSGMDIVLETYGNKVQDSIKVEDSNVCNGIGRQLAEGQQRNIPGLLLKLGTFYTQTQSGRSYNFSSNEAIMYVGVGCVVSTKDSDNNKLFSAIRTVSPPGECDNLDPSQFYYETSKTVRGSNGRQKLHECKPLQYFHQWEFYPIYGMLLPLELQPTTIKGSKMCCDVKTHFGLNSDVVRMQIYYPGPRYQAINTKPKFDLFQYTESNNFMIDIEKFQEKFYSFLQTVQTNHNSHHNWLKDKGISVRLEMASRLDLFAPNIDITSHIQTIVDDVYKILRTGLVGYNVNTFVEYQRIFLLGLKTKLDAFATVLSDSDDFSRFADVVPGCCEIKQIMENYFSGRNLIRNSFMPTGRISCCIARPLLVPVNKQVEELLNMSLQLNPSTNLRNVLKHSGNKVWRKFNYFTHFAPKQYKEPHCCNQCYKIFTPKRREGFAYHACVIEDRTKLALLKISSTKFQLNLVNATSVLSKDQSQAVFRSVVLEERGNVFLTGRAGSGKTFCLTTIINTLFYSYGEDSIAVMAYTGLVADRIGGETIHSFFGIPYNIELDRLSVAQMMGYIIDNRFNKHHDEALKAFARYEYIVIDEVSLLSSYALDTISEVFQQLSGPTMMQPSSISFGGKTVILAGDVLQLPPISNRNYAKSVPPFFFFANAFWKDNRFEVIYLQGNHRCNETNNYKSLLNEIRDCDEIEDASIDAINKWGKRVCPRSAFIALCISTFVSHDDWNTKQLNALKGEAQRAKDHINAMITKWQMYDLERTMKLLGSDMWNQEAQKLQQRLNFSTASNINSSQCQKLSITYPTDQEAVFDECCKKQCNCSPLILVSTTREVQKAQEVLIAATDAAFLAIANDKVFLNGTELSIIENSEIYKILKNKYEMANNALSEIIVVEPNTTAIAAKTKKELGLIRNALGSIHGYEDYSSKEILLFCPDVGKSGVWDTLEWKTVPLIPLQLKLSRLNDNRNYTINNVEYTFQRSQFPIKSVLAINTHVVQGQEIMRPTIVSLARNSQLRDMAVSYGNVYTQLSRFTTPDDLFLVHSLNRKDLHAHPVCLKIDQHHRSKIRSYVDYIFNSKGEMVPDDTSILQCLHDEEDEILNDEQNESGVIEDCFGHFNRI